MAHRGVTVNSIYNNIGHHNDDKTMGITFINALLVRWFEIY